MWLGLMTVLSALFILNVTFQPDAPPKLLEGELRRLCNTHPEQTLVSTQKYLHSKHNGQLGEEAGGVLVTLLTSSALILIWERRLPGTLPLLPQAEEVAFFWPGKIKSSLLPKEALSLKPVSARSSGSEISQDSAPAGADV